MSISMIIGRDGRLVWDNFPVSLKYWRIEWDKPDGSWHGKAIISQTDLRAMMEEHAKSKPIPINGPIFAEFHKGKEDYSGQFLISSFPDSIDSNPVVDFTGTGKLNLKEHGSPPAPSRFYRGQGDGIIAIDASDDIGVYLEAIPNQKREAYLRSVLADILAKRSYSAMIARKDVEGMT